MSTERIAQLERELADCQRDKAALAIDQGILREACRFALNRFEGRVHSERGMSAISELRAALSADPDATLTVVRDALREAKRLSMSNVVRCQFHIREAIRLLGEVRE